MTNFRKLHTVEFNKNATIQRPTRSFDIDLGSPATEVFIDFDVQTPLMLEESTSVEGAKELMAKAHVRLKLIVDAEERLKGIVSMADLFSVKVQRAALAKRIERHDVTVADIMTDVSNLNAISINQILSASVGDILETIERYGDQYILVVDPEENTIRGLVSAYDLACRLHIPLQIYERANTFAEIYQALHY